MKIVCTVTNDLSHDQRMHRICSTLQAAGHEVTLVGRLLPDSPTLPERTYRTHRLPCRATAGKRFYLEFNYRLYRFLRAVEKEVICAVDLDTLLPAVLLRSTKVKVVYDAHEWFSETPEVVKRPVVRALWRGMGRGLVPRTDARYTVGQTISEQLERDYGEPFQVVRNAPFKYNESYEEKAGGVIIYQGMLNPGRGLDVAIKALIELPECSLTIVGSGPEEDRLRSLVATLSIQDRVEFMGFQPPERLPELTSRAWLGINLLAGESPSYYYSLANKSLDYVQAGLPSLQMDFPEYRLLQQQYGVFALLEEFSVAAFVRVVRQLLDQPEQYAALRQNCMRAADELCWEAEAPKLRAVYAALRR